MNVLFVASVMVCLPHAAFSASVCEVLVQAPRLAGTVVVVDAVFAGGVSHGYRLFDESAKRFCRGGGRVLKLLPVLEFCDSETDRCPESARLGQGQLIVRTLLGKLNPARKGVGSRMLRVRLRGLLVFDPSVEVYCDGDVCWGSGFGDGSVAAAIVPLTIERIRFGSLN